MKAAGEDDDKDTSLFQIPGINQPHSYVPDMVEDETHLHEAVKFAGIEPFWRTKVNARRHQQPLSTSAY